MKTLKMLITEAKFLRPIQMTWNFRMQFDQLLKEGEKIGKPEEQSKYITKLTFSSLSFCHFFDNI